VLEDHGKATEPSRDDGPFRAARDALIFRPYLFFSEGAPK